MNYQQDILNIIEYAVSYLDKNYKIIFINEAYCRLYNCKPEEFIGKSKSELVGEKYFNKQIKPHLEKCLSGEYVKIDGFIILPDSKKVYVEKKYIPHYNEKKEVIGFYCILSNQTEDKLISEALLKAEKAVKNSDKRYQLMLQNLQIGVVVHDLDTSIVLSNYKAEELLGLDHAQMQGKKATDPCWCFVYEDGLRVPIDDYPVNKIFKTKEPFQNLVYGVYRQEGDLVWLQVNGFPFLNSKKEITQVIISFSDISEEKKAKSEALENEYKYKNYTEKSPLGIYITDKHGNCSYANEHWLKLAGMDLDEALGKGWVDAVHKEDQLNISENWRNSIVSGGKWSFEHRIVDKEGNINWVECSVKKMLDYYNKPIGYLGLNIDINDRKLHEKVIENSRKESKLQNQISNSIILSGNGDSFSEILPLILEITESEFGFIGYIDPGEENELICPAIIYKVSDKWKKVSNTLVFPKDEWSSIWGDCLLKEKSLCSNKDLSLSMDIEFENLKNAMASPIMFNKDLTGIIVVGNSVDGCSEEKEELLQRICNYISPLLRAKLKEDIYREKILDAKKKAEMSNNIKTEFLHNMSHEIRTPMNGIIGFSNMLDTPDLSDDRRKYYTQIIKNSGNQLLKIIDDILEISRLDTKQETINESEFCLNDLLIELYSIFELQIFGRNISLYLKRELDDKDSLIKSDRVKINTILSNLIDNALKFTSKGYVEFGYNVKEDKLVLYVKDTGVGISKKNHNSIFERFSQEESVLSRKAGGLGLGLAICLENTKLLEGEITLDSKKGEGTTFFVTIPFKPVNLVIDNVSSSNLKENTQSNTEKKITKPTILVAEDVEINFLYIEAILQTIQVEYNLLHAKNGKEAVEICETNNNIALILMDVKMPIMDGYQATKVIKSKYPNLPIIMQTAFTLESDKEMAIKCGANDFISKPIDKEKLIELVNKYLSLKTKNS